MQLVVITSPTRTPNEVSLCKAMHRAGLQRLHVRKPQWGREDACSFLSRLDQATLETVVLHDWHELAADFPVKVAHSALSAVSRQLS